MKKLARNYFVPEAGRRKFSRQFAICNCRSRNYFARPRNLSPQPVSKQGVGGFYKLPTYCSGFVTQGEHL
jgi:hypothetical protein